MNGLGSICSKGGHVYPTGTAVGTAGSWFVKKKKKKYPGHHTATGLASSSYFSVWEKENY